MVKLDIIMDLFVGFISELSKKTQQLMKSKKMFKHVLISIINLNYPISVLLN